MQRIVILVAVGAILLMGMLACSSDSSGGEKGKEINLFVDADAPTPTDEAASEATEAQDVAEDDGAIALAAELFLDVLSPADETVLRSPEIEVVGKTLPTAIVSVNGKMAPVDATGAFAVTGPLENGPNFIEVVASTVGGSEISEILSVICIR